MRVDTNCHKNTQHTERLHLLKSAACIPDIEALHIQSDSDAGGTEPQRTTENKLQ